jgi:hypothetical protein
VGGPQYFRYGGNVQVGPETDDGGSYTRQNLEKQEEIVIIVKIKDEMH